MTEPICSSDRWTCPRCGRTVAIDALSHSDIAVAIRAVQDRHTDLHREADRIFAAAGHPEPRHTGRNAGDVDRQGRRRPPRPRRST